MLEAVHSDKSDQGEVATKIEMQSVSVDIWDKKYRLKKKDGNFVDETIQDTYERVAEALAYVEPSNKKEWKENFLWALQHGAIPAGRITSNAGAKEHKPATSTINCTVSGAVQDSMTDILDKVHEAGLTLIGAAFTRVSDLMHSGDAVPLVKPELPMQEVLLVMTSRSFGCAGVVGSEGALEGIITDGDLRRAMIENDDVMNASAQSVMTAGPLTIKPDASMGEAEQRMQEARIQCLVVADEDAHIVGIVQIF